MSSEPTKQKRKNRNNKKHWKKEAKERREKIIRKNFGEEEIVSLNQAESLSAGKLQACFKFLQTWKNDRANWKYQRIHQGVLFRKEVMYDVNLFSISEFNILLEYISAVHNPLYRQRLATCANEIVTEWQKAKTAYDGTLVKKQELEKKPENQAELLDQLTQELAQFYADFDLAQSKYQRAQEVLRVLKQSSAIEEKNKFVIPLPTKEIETPLDKGHDKMEEEPVIKSVDEKSEEKRGKIKGKGNKKETRSC